MLKYFSSDIFGHQLQYVFTYQWCENISLILLKIFCVINFCEWIPSMKIFSELQCTLDGGHTHYTHTTEKEVFNLNAGMPSLKIAI